MSLHSNVNPVLSDLVECYLCVNTQFRLPLVTEGASALFFLCVHWKTKKEICHKYLNFSEVYKFRMLQNINLKSKVFCIHGYSSKDINRMLLGPRGFFAPKYFEFNNNLTIYRDWPFPSLFPCGLTAFIILFLFPSSPCLTVPCKQKCILLSRSFPSFKLPLSSNLEFLIL